ncbi:hypothetical protein [Nocardioides aequoreus]|uniref:hypothetical protein n=1 Tax=Nocardioides aequoreus TaxID=397278 RepID=UPI00068B0508|nr:hypothetical protein [Nocardioides aequoreus]
MGGRFLGVLLVVALAVVAGVGVAVWRGHVDVPLLSGCTTELDGLTVDLSVEQAENAALIAAVGVQRGLPARAVSIALATAYQESKIRNIDYGDRDSLGLFQQRPSQGWGTEAQIMDARYAIDAFYDALEQVDGYEEMRITEAAQRVQRSGFPEAYEDHAEDARALASVLTGYSPGGRFSCSVGSPDTSQPAGLTTLLRDAYGGLEVTADGTGLRVAVPEGEAGQRLGWSVAQFAVAHSAAYGVAGVDHAGRQWRAGADSRDGWTDATGADRVGAAAVVIRMD